MRGLLLLVAGSIIIITSCTKDHFIMGKNAFLLLSDTAIHFDTVFTSAGSVTKQFKLFNINDQKLRISNLQLMGGAVSVFKINVNGTSGTQFSNIDMEGGDSLYVFAEVNINPTTGLLPFIIEDSIRIDYNGNTQFVKLDAYGQNAHFLRGTILTQNTTWKADLPYVLLDTFAVSAGTTLTIEKGTRIFVNANTPFTVQGSLQINGTSDSTGEVVFQNNRLDAPYKDQPGTWQGIYFAPNSRNNKINFTTIKNALQGIAIDEQSSLEVNDCKIDNCADAGVITNNSSISATNCLISNCSYDVYCADGGNYSFTNCTLAGYSNKYLFHQYPVLTLKNSNDAGTEEHRLKALFQNCIVWGEDGFVKDEVDAEKSNSGISFEVNFITSLYKSIAQNPSIIYSKCIQNTDPQFQNIDAQNHIYDFHLSPSSPCIDAGSAVPVATDLDGMMHTQIPDMGCYEFH